MISLRPGILDDTNEVLTMRKEFYSIDQYPFDAELQEKLTIAFILNPAHGMLYIVYKEDLIIGYVCLTYGYSFEYGGKTAFIDELYLKPGHRSQGYGTQIMEFIILKAREVKIATLHLEAEKHNDKANQLYAKNGFRNTNRYLLYHSLK
jgi:GNAT superfamily N-acetyltransferase